MRTNGGNSPLQGEDAQIAQGLRSMGLTEYEIRVYLGILRHPGSRIPEIARHSSVPQPKVYGTIKRLIGRGLCESHLGPVNTYSSVPPKAAFAPLLEELKSQHEEARDVVKSLQKEHAAPSDAHSAREGRVKLFQGKQAIGRNFHYLLSAVEKDVALVSRLPLVVRDDDELLEAALARGVRVRILSEVPAEYEIHKHPVIRRQLALGCESRRIATVPMRMGVFDQRIALLPMNEPHEKDTSMVLEVRNQGVARGMLAVFDRIWEEAAPITGSRRRRSEA